MTHRTTFLTAVSAAALIAMTGFASAQTGPAGGMQTQPGGAMQKEAPASGGMMRNDSAPTPGGAMKREGAQPGAAMQPSDRNAQGAPDQKAPNTAQTREPQGSGTMGKQPTNAAQGKDGDMKGGAKMGQQNEGGKDRATVGSASSGSMTGEQKTKIRESMMGGNAPRVNNVNFSINVGTVVPSHVHVVAVPPLLVEYHPEWRGYRYFVVNDEIIIVEPGTLRIVAVLPV